MVFNIKFKVFFYILHLFFIVVTLIGPFWKCNIVLIQIFTLLSWRLNNNKCIITQLEDWLFGETLVDVYFKLIGKSNLYTKYRVPFYQRAFLYFTFILALINCYIISIFKHIIY